MSEQSSAGLTRQQLYDRIRASSKDEVVLAEMKRLGFWPEHQDQPHPSEQLIHRQAELSRELRDLLTRQQLLADPEKALQEMHKQRKREALERREETHRRHARESFEQQLNWYDRNQGEITHLGDIACGSLQQVQADGERLRSTGLPQIESHMALAKAMGIPLPELRFLAYNREVSKVSHYQQFKVAKKSGGQRLIAAPMPRIKRAQYWILDNILSKVAIAEQAHGFVPGRSICSNAQLHTQAHVVINLDLKDFFPSISYRRIKGLYASLGYGEAIATILGLLTTYAETQELSLDGETFHIAQGQRCLPQGAPTSPMLTNILCWRLDKRLRGAAEVLGFVYSRYADDLTFSSKSAAKEAVSKLLWRVRQIVKSEGFQVHPDKTRVMYRHKRQEVTGIVVNDKPNVDRQTLKRFRALLFQIDKDGPQGKSWGYSNPENQSGPENPSRQPALFPAIDGFANFVAMVNPEKGIPLQQQVARLKQRHGVRVKPGRIGELNRKLFRLKAAQGLAPRGNWWIPRQPPRPVRLKTDLERKQERKQARQQERAQTTPTTQPQRVPGSTSNTTANPSSNAERPKISKPITGGQIYLWLLLFWILMLVLKGLLHLE